jgi:hypothetical protein
MVMATAGREAVTDPFLPSCNHVDGAAHLVCDLVEIQAGVIQVTSNGGNLAEVLLVVIVDITHVCRIVLK